MNLIVALQYLGFKNFKDFEVHANDMTKVAIWKSKRKQPTSAALKKAWTAATRAPAKILPLRIPAPKPEPVVLSLDDLKKEAERRIDRASETQRGQHTTWGSGQSLVYQEKAEQAADFVAQDYPENLDSFPFIRVEVKAMNKTPKKAADDILKAKSSWIAKNAGIEEIRLSGKQAVGRARSENGVNTARDEALAKLDAV